MNTKKKPKITIGGVRYISTKEAGRRMGCSPSTVAKHIRDGRIAGGLRRSGAWYIPEAPAAAPGHLPASSKGADDRALALLAVLDAVDAARRAGCSEGQITAILDLRGAA